MIHFPSPELYALSLSKIRARWGEFQTRGWTQLDLTCCATKKYGHHGLALLLRRDQTIGRIWVWCCEILGGVAGNGERAQLTYWRSAPLCQLLATVGDVVPPELRDEWRRAKL